MLIYVSDNNLWRMERVSKVLRIAGKILGISSEQFELLIDEVHDNKGQLTIHWKVPQTKRQAEAFTAAWEECKEHGPVLHFPDGVAL